MTGLEPDFCGALTCGFPQTRRSGPLYVPSIFLKPADTCWLGVEISTTAGHCQPPAGGWRLPSEPSEKGCVAVEFTAGTLVGVLATLFVIGAARAVKYRTSGPGAVARQERKAAAREVREQERGEDS